MRDEFDDIANEFNQLAIDNTYSVPPVAPLNLNWCRSSESPIDELEDRLLSITQRHIEDGDTREELIVNIYQFIINVQNDGNDPEILAFQEFFNGIDSEGWIENLREWFAVRLRARTDQVQENYFMPEIYLNRLRQICSYIAYVVELMTEMNVR